MSFLKNVLGSKKKPILEEPMFRNGELVRVTSDEDLVRKKQPETGGYSEHLMRRMLGKTVLVLHCEKKSVSVRFEGRTSDLHQDILKKLNNSRTTRSSNQNNNNSATHEPFNSQSHSLNQASTIPVPNESIFESISNDNLQSSNQFRNFSLSLSHTDRNDLSIDMPSIDDSAQLVSSSVDPIFDAVRSGDITRLYSYMDAGNINFHDSDMNTPLNLACKLGHKEIAIELLEFGYDLNDPDKDGNYPTHNCVLKNYLDIMHELFRIRPDIIQLKNREGKTCQDLLSITNNSASQMVLNVGYDEQDRITADTSMISNAAEISLNNLNHIEEDYSNLDSGIECKICVSRPISMRLSCGHVLCNVCSDRIDFKCPFCKSDIVDKKKIFL